MKRRLFVDSNIVIDALSAKREGHAPAKLLLALGAAGEFELWTSPSQWTDEFYILSNGGRSAASRSVRILLGKLRKSVRVCTLGETEVDAALGSPWDDFEDAVVYQAACSVKPDAIITRNLRDFKQSAYPVYDCEAFFSLLESEHGVSYAALGN